MSCLFVDHLTVIDCAYLDAARGLVGESWIVDLELEGDLDAQSMVLDFGEVKRRIKRAIDDGPDHTLIVPTAAPGLQLNLQGNDTDLVFPSARGEIRHRAPRIALTLLPVATVTADAVADHLQTALRAVVPASVQRIGLRLYPETIDGPYYHYVHGLKKHDGQCQRIAHGHRSRIEVRVNNHRDASLESSLAEAWRDIYLGSREDVAAEHEDRIDFAYRAAEGHFALSLPRAHCALIDQDSTVECLADVLLDHARGLRPGQRVEVRAYEGVRKGAVAR